MALARHARPLPLASLTRDLLLRRAQELFHDELRRSGRATGCGGYGTLFPFVGPPRCVCTLCEYSPAAVGGGSCRLDVAWQSQPGASMSQVWSFLIGGVGLLAGLPGADLLVDAGALWILLGQVPRHIHHVLSPAGAGAAPASLL